MISIKRTMEHMTDTGKLTPYPNMTDEELSEYERYCYETYDEEPLYKDWGWWKTQVDWELKNKIWW